MKKHAPLPLLLFLSGITFSIPGFGQKNTLPRFEFDSLPEHYNSVEYHLAVYPDNETWWDAFKTPQIVSLIRLAVANNNDAKAALARIEAARQGVRQAYASAYPTLGVSAGYEWDHTSGRQSKPYSQGLTVSDYSVGLNLQWEIDIFGRVAERVKSAKASLGISEMDHRGLMISLATEIAEDYSALKMYERQLEIAEKHLDSEMELSKITNSKWQNGLVSQLDVIYTDNMLATTRLRFPQLRSQVKLMKNALATLCAVDSHSLDSLLNGPTNIAMPSLPPLGLPADLLRRRPDVVEAELEVERAAASLGIAKKDYLPTLSLSASGSTEVHNIKYLFGKNSYSWSVGPQLSWTIFDGFSRTSQVASCRASMEASIANYNQVISSAYQDVNNALANYEASRESLALYDEKVRCSKNQEDITLQRYKLGLIGISDVTNSQISYLESLTARATAENACFDAVVNLYKALGGGWKWE